MGYDVWADFRLRGGSKHWREIEEKIRNQAVKVLVVTSHSSREAEGVDNEINIAKGIEKELRLENFIIQLKIDDLPYTQLPPALNNRLAISFKGDWGEGLRRLIKQFIDEKILRSCADQAKIQLFSTVLQEKSDTTTSTREPSFASWLPIGLPITLHVYTFPGSAKVAENMLLSAGIPAYSFSNTLISFALPESVAYGVGEKTSNLRHVTATTDSWLRETSSANFSIQKLERRRAFSGLLNSAWEIQLRHAGLVEFLLSQERAFFIPSTQKLSVKQPYKDPMGRSTRPITLVGLRQKGSAFWHAAISARAALSPFPLYSVRLHVAFTDDGQTPIAKGARAFRLRKSFCKSFWNDRWRRIYFALIAYLSDANGKMSLRTGGDEQIVVRPPLHLATPYSIATDLAVQIDESEPDDEIAELEPLSVDLDADDEEHEASGDE